MTDNQTVEQLVARLNALRAEAEQHDTAAANKAARTLAFLLVDALDAARPMAMEPPAMRAPTAPSHAATPGWLPGAGLFGFVIAGVIIVTFFVPGLGPAPQPTPRREAVLAPEEWTFQPSEMNGYTAQKHQTPAERAATQRADRADLRSTQAATSPAATQSSPDFATLLQSMPGVQRVIQSAGGTGYDIYLQRGTWERWDGAQRQQAADNFQNAVNRTSTDRTAISLKDFGGTTVAQSSTFGPGINLK